MGVRSVVAGLVALAALGVAASALSATRAGRPYGLVPTRACLQHQGVTFGGASEGFAASLPLTPSERARILVGFGSAPGATTPIGIYAVFGSSATNAIALRKTIERHLLPVPTRTNSLFGERGNAAWLIAATSAPPPAAKWSFAVAGCLRAGPNTVETPATLPALTKCIAFHRGFRFERATVKLWGVRVPPGIARYLATYWIPVDKLDLQDGPIVFVIIDGTDTKRATTMSAQLAEAVARAGFRNGVDGVTRNAAWIAIPQPNDTPAQLASAEKLLANCLH